MDGRASVATTEAAALTSEENVVNEKPHSSSPFQAIRAIDYTVIFVREMAAMRRFYEDVLGFPLLRELSPGWIDCRVGDNALALARPSLTAADAPTPRGSASLQLAFKVAAPEVDQCAEELVRRGVDLLSPPTDRDFGHRTLLFRDPDGNLLEVFADVRRPPRTRPRDHDKQFTGVFQPSWWEVLSLSAKSSGPRPFARKRTSVLSIASQFA